MSSITKLSFVLFLSSFFALANVIHASQITGKVMDAKTGESLIGVTVMIEGSSFGATTDYEGKYSINNVKPGVYNIVFSYISYNKKSIKGVEVKQKEATILNCTMEELKTNLQEVVIRSEVKRESANAVLLQQKNASSVSSGVSADLIRKTPDRTTADVLKRISGASVQDNRFAIIRGLNDRYNMAFLNGAPLPSTESDRKAFSLDVIPASVIDNMAIVKGASPDLPADFAGGIIQINTKDIPEENSISINASAQYHSLTTFQNGLNGNTSSTDWLGFDGGTRKLPSGLMNTTDNRLATTDQKVEQTKLFNNNFQANNITYRPNFSLQFSASKRMKLFNNDLGVVFAMSYNNSNKYTPFTTSTGLPVVGLESVKSESSDGSFFSFDNYRNTIVSGAVLNFAYKVGKNSKFTFKNLLTANAEDQTIHQTGITYTNRIDPNNTDQTKFDNYTYYYQSSRLLSSQFSGEHMFTKNKIKLTYTAGLNNIHREVPDYRRVLYQSNFRKSSGDTSFSPYLVAASGSKSFTPQNSGRYSSTLDEHMYSFGYDLSIPFKLSIVKKSQVKIGGMHVLRDRTFAARNFLYTQDDQNYDNSIASGIETLGPGQTFANQNISKATHFISETTQGTDAYNATSKLNAAYAMLDFKALDRLRVIGGFRVEQFSQRLNWVDLSGKDAKIDTSYVDFLPSVNLIYELTDKVNLRASASKTLSRPEFREFAPMAFYEINYNAIITGNPLLVKTQVYNYDFKFEYYPTAGQLFSVNPFYKEFVNPVQSVSQGGGTGINNFSYINAAKAQTYGVEFEARLNMGSVFKSSKSEWLKALTVFANYSLIYSKVTLSDSGNNIGNSVNDMPLQGQSPYVFNAGVMYSNAKKKLDVSATVNQIGRRLAFVNQAREYMIWENPRTVVDLSVSKTFYKKLVGKITLGDILAQPLVYYQDLNKNGKYDEGSDVSTFKYRNGNTTSFSLSYTF